MDWEQVRNLVESQIDYWRIVGRLDWVQALEECLRRAERSEGLREAVVDLRQRLETCRTDTCRQILDK
jgi:hypothetical protein